MSNAPFVLLLRAQLRQRLGLSLVRQQLRERPPGWWKGLGVGAVAAVGIGGLVGMLVWLVWALGRTLSSVGIARLLPLMGLAVGMAGTLVAGMGFLLGVLYLSRDAEALAALPVTGRTVFAVKISQAFLGEAVTSIPLTWPMFIIYGILTKAGAFYYAKAFIVWLCALSLPLTLAALVSLPLMRWSALWRRRDLVAVIGGLALMVGFVAGEIWLTSRLTVLIDGGLLLRWLIGRVDLFDRIARAIPPVWLGYRALTVGGASSIGYLAGMAALSGALSAATLWLAGKIYQAGVSAQSESHMRASRAVLGGRAFRRRSPLLAVTIREAKLTLRTPVYAMNTVTIIIIMPVMLLAMMLVGGSGVDPELDALINLLTRFFNDPWMIAMVSAALSMVIGCLNIAASTSVSREGRMYAWSRVTPVPYGTLAMGKMLFSLVLAWLLALLMAVSLGVSMRLPVAGLALGFALSLPAMVPVTALQLAVDIIRPKLLWTNPIEAVKQNMNSMLGSLAALAYSAILIVPTALLLVRGHVPARAMYMAQCPLNAALAAAALVALKRRAGIWYSRAEI
ncbi:MAG: hypothetical protein LBS11_12330 [Oscillospiraceae bacterium]|jgi:ABC-2 type transport system permease protein|nr:hypothetical protein [Oscillospiraceae bacterium]